MQCAICLKPIRPVRQEDGPQQLGDLATHYTIDGKWVGEFGNDFYPLEWRKEGELIVPNHMHTPVPNGERCRWPVPHAGT